jgi:hypothetical protein
MRRCLAGYNPQNQKNQPKKSAYQAYQLQLPALQQFLLVRKWP